MHLQERKLDQLGMQALLRVKHSSAGHQLPFRAAVAHKGEAHASGPLGPGPKATL